jgi:hypothetical protein
LKEKRNTIFAAKTGTSKSSSELRKEKAQADLQGGRRAVLHYRRSKILGGRLHPNGKRYIKIKEVKNVYDHLREIPLAAYGCWSQFSPVTPENVEAALDVLNSQSVLHEIDTRWGTDCGVYKDSDFYEPGECDFY